MQKKFREEDISRIIEMAWEDRTPFDSIRLLYGLSMNDVRSLMKLHLKKNFFGVDSKNKGKKNKTHS